MAFVSFVLRNLKGLLNIYYCNAPPGTKTRFNIFLMLNDNKQICEESKKIILSVFNDTTATNKKVQFLLDCSTLPEVIAEVQNKSFWIYSNFQGHGAIASVNLD